MFAYRLPLSLMSHSWDVHMFVSSWLLFCLRTNEITISGTKEHTHENRIIAESDAPIAVASFLPVLAKKNSGQVCIVYKNGVGILITFIPIPQYSTIIFIVSFNCVPLDSFWFEKWIVCKDDTAVRERKIKKC